MTTGESACLSFPECRSKNWESPFRIEQEELVVLAELLVGLGFHHGIRSVGHIEVIVKLCPCRYHLASE